MTLPSFPPLSMSQIATELATAPPLSLNDANARALAGIPSGPISILDFLGKSSSLLSGSMVVGRTFTLQGPFAAGYTSGLGGVSPIGSISVVGTTVISMIASFTTPGSNSAFRLVTNDSTFAGKTLHIGATETWTLVTPFDGGGGLWFYEMPIGSFVSILETSVGQTIPFSIN